MILGERLRELREQKIYPRATSERRTGLLRCYVSRVENGHTIPSIDLFPLSAAGFIRASCNPSPRLGCVCLATGNTGGLSYSKHLTC